MPKQLEVRVRVRNNLLIQARLDMGLDTQSAAARAIGIAPVRLNQFECFRTSPVGVGNYRGRWTPTALRIATFYGLDPSDLWPKALKEIQEPVLVGYADVRELQSGASPLALPSARTEDNEMREILDRMLSKLNPRSARILRMYYGFNGADPMTMVEIGTKVGVCSARVAQIIHTSTNKLRKGKDARYLAEWIEDDELWGEREGTHQQEAILT